MRIGFVFPGQGSQAVGMGRDLANAFPEAEHTFTSADEALHEPLSALCFEGPEDRLMLTANTQPAVLTVSVAAVRAFVGRTGIEPFVVAGHSLGEYSALVAANAVDFQDAVRVTRSRGAFMQEAVPPGQGAMAAVMGPSPEEIRAACDEAARGEVVSPANLNAPGQIVISGHAAAVQRAGRILGAKGAKVIPLKVSAPFHCSLMKPAADRLSGVLKGVVFRAPSAPVVTNVEARPESDPDRLRTLLVEQVTSPVRWEESVRQMIELGVERFVEFGPGKVTAGLIKRIDKGAKVVSIGDSKSLEEAIKELGA